MTTETENVNIRVSATDQASATLARVRGQLTSLDRIPSRLGAGFAKLNTGLKNTAGRIKNLLSGPVGLIGLGGAVFGLEKFLSESISKSIEFGEAVAKVSKITGMAAKSTSEWVDTLDYYGVSAEKAVNITGMMEKNIGTLTKGVGLGAAQFFSDFGLNLKKTSISADDLADAMQTLKLKTSTAAEKAKAATLINKYQNAGLKDTNTLLYEAADYWNNKGIPQATKAAALAKLFGRSWRDLIPVLSQGSAKLRAANADAIKLSETDLKNMDDAKEASREWTDALGDLQIMVGAKLLPKLTALAKTASAFVRNHTDDIVKFFEDAATFAQKAGQAFQDYVVPAFQAIASAWDRVPDDLKRLLVGGAVANKVLKATIGIDLGDVMKPLIGGLGGLLGRGSSPATPMYVKDISGGLGGAGKGGSNLVGLGATAVVVAGFAVWADEMLGIAEENKELLAQGINPGAYRFNNLSNPDKNTAEKHNYGMIPTGPIKAQIINNKLNVDDTAVADALQRQKTAIDRAAHMAGKDADDVIRAMTPAQQKAAARIVAAQKQAQAKAMAAASRAVAINRAGDNRIVGAVQKKKLSVNVQHNTTFAVSGKAIARETWKFVRADANFAKGGK